MVVILMFIVVTLPVESVLQDVPVAAPRVHHAVASSDEDDSSDTDEVDACTWLVLR